MYLNDWQVDRVEAPTGTFDGFDAHLVKINYDVDLKPRASETVSWFEIAFDFVSDVAQNPHVTVVDAVPHSGTLTKLPKNYVLNQFLNFVPCDDGASAHAHLPATGDRIDTFGIGGRRVRWRHVSLDATNVQSGSYAAWLVLLTPAGQTAQRVEFSARYDLSLGGDLELRQTQQPTEFRLPLSAPPDAPGVVTPSFSATVEARSESYHPLVFICYAHDSLRHKENARRFGNLLVRNGVDAHMDQWYGGHRKDWDTWARHHINKVDFVIVLASPLCRKAFDGELSGLENPGIRSESRTIVEMLHSHRDEWTAKVLPVVLPDQTTEDIPQTLQPWTADHYDIHELTLEGIDELLRAMTGVPRHSRPSLGRLPFNVLKPLSGTES
ncbi:toll/interleukin-1 receptor domain-containing protein [Streptomyces sp. NPDC058319]|uniref:toll/interleukin-1 receptor domain-containing protein n=1 Tax=unclassified Streptomyces TaxID=2593676 RepID=UPI0036E6D3BF